MPIKLKISNEQLKSMLQSQKDRIILALQQRLLRVAENFVTNARNNGNYKDHTGNLRSSIGYVILLNGIQVDSSFKAYPAAAAAYAQQAGIGIQLAQTLIDEISKNFPYGLALIVVAGAEYAAAVEAKNFDVITSSSLIAAEELKQGLQNIQNFIDKQPIK